MGGKAASPVAAGTTGQELGTGTEWEYASAPESRDIVTIRPVPNSIMPDGLADRMTDQEMRDLLAYLQARK